jgi:dienelactone hydrolase
LLALALLAGCAFAPPPTHPRPRLPATGLPSTTPDLPLATLAEWHDLGAGNGRGVLTAGDETVRFELRAAAGAGPHPFVLLVPILAGGKELMEAVANGLAARGFDVAFCERAGGALTAGQRGPELDELFRRTVLHQRLVLQWQGAHERQPVPRFVLGLSLGGMVTTVVGALEPDLDGLAICLSGADLPDLVATSAEARVERWREWRRTTDGVGDDHLRWELATSLQHEPLRFAGAIATERVLMVSAAFDTVVPRHNQDALWEALGRPARLVLPLGHYSAGLWFQGILDAVADHFHSRVVAAASTGRTTQAQNARDPGS